MKSSRKTFKIPPVVHWVVTVSIPLQVLNYNEMNKEKLLLEIQNYNDEIGYRFQKTITSYTKSYEQGAIHHKEYITQVKTCCEQAEDLLVDLNLYKENK